MFRLLAVVTLFAWTSAATRADDDKKTITAKPDTKKDAKVDRAKLFARLDANGDAKLTKEEYQASLANAKKKVEAAGKGKGGAKTAEALEKVFEKMDSNKDGVVAKDEFEKFDPKAKTKVQGKRKTDKRP